jgi:hypothetical protein
LAKYDYIEEAEGGQGREKPWRMVHEGHSWSEYDDDPEISLAAEAASEAFIEFAFAQTRERFRRASIESAEWREAIGADDSTEFLTPEETVAIRTELRDILQRYKERKDKPEVRPEGARPVHFFLATTVAPRIKTQ